MAEQRVVMQCHNWMGIPHQKLYDDIHGGSGTAAIEAAQNAYAQAQIEYDSIFTTLRAGLNRLAAAHQGAAAEASQAAVSAYGTWINEASVVAGNDHSGVTEFSGSYATAKNDMPPPVAVTAVDSPIDSVKDFFGGTTPREKQEQAANDAHVKAAQVMTTFFDSGAGAANAMPPWTAPQQVAFEVPVPPPAGSGGITEAGAGAPSLGGAAGGGGGGAGSGGGPAGRVAPVPEVTSPAAVAPAGTAGSAAPLAPAAAAGSVGSAPGGAGSGAIPLGVVGAGSRGGAAGAASPGGPGGRAGGRPGGAGGSGAGGVAGRSGVVGGGAGAGGASGGRGAGSGAGGSAGGGRGAGPGAGGSGGAARAASGTTSGSAGTIAARGAAGAAGRPGMGMMPMGTAGSQGTGDAEHRRKVPLEDDLFADERRFAPPVIGEDPAD